MYVNSNWGKKYTLLIRSCCKIAVDKAVPTHIVLSEDQGHSFLRALTSAVFIFVNLMGENLCLIFTISDIEHLCNVSFFFILESSVWDNAHEFPLQLAPSKKQGGVWDLAGSEYTP